jgi:pimeloyl-ACP methyl ester carboxylesterase
MIISACLVNVICAGALVLIPPISEVDSAPPQPQGKLVDLGGYRLHIKCSGHGGPTVVVENGLGDFSFDWILVQNRVANFARVCTYDRAGYAWSDPGPKPRSFDQLNLELHEALAKLGERSPYVMVGHSFGGPVVRNFALKYPKEVAGVVFVDAAFEGQRVGIGGKQTIQLGKNAPNRAVPPPHLMLRDSDRSARREASKDETHGPLDAMYKVLPANEQGLQMWAQRLATTEEAEDSQREWSEVIFAKWLTRPQGGTLGKIPVLVLARSEGGYEKGLDVSAEQMERERKEGQLLLTRLSSNSKLTYLHSGHNMELEAPDGVANAIRQVVEAVRTHKSLRPDTNQDAALLNEKHRNGAAAHRG